MIDPSDIDRMVRIARTGFAKNAGAGVSRALSEAGYPTRKGWSGSIPVAVRDKIKRELIEDHGVPVESFSENADRKPRPNSRRAALETTRYEKKAESVQRDRVLIKPSPGKVLVVDDKEILLPDACHLSVPVEMAGRIETRGVILVENLEVFQDFHLLDFALPERNSDYLVVFRGKPHVARQDTAEAFLRRLGVPVAACFDIDPSGLSNALSTPFFEDIIWPGREALMEMKRLWRSDRYQAQKQVMGRLDGATGALAEARDFLRESGAGVMQEAFLSLHPGTRSHTSSSSS